MKIHLEVFWVVMQCKGVVAYQRSGGTSYPNLQGEVTSICPLKL